MHVPFMSTQEVSNITVGCVSSDGIFPAHGGGIMNTERVRRKYNNHSFSNFNSVLFVTLISQPPKSSHDSMHYRSTNRLVNRLANQLANQSVNRLANWHTMRMYILGTQMNNFVSLVHVHN